MRVHTHVIEKGENIKMSTNREMQNWYKEEEEMVERVGGKGERISASSVTDEEGESREGPSKFRTENPKLDKTQCYRR